MKPIILHFTPWTGDHSTDVGEEIAAIFLQKITIDGEEIPYARASIEWEGTQDFLCLRLEGVPIDFSINDPEDWLMGTDRKAGILLLPVRGVEMIGVPSGLVHVS